MSSWRNTYARWLDTPLYKRYVDDTLVRMPSAAAAVVLFITLYSLHSSLTFTMELLTVNKISFYRHWNCRERNQTWNSSLRKPTNTDLLLHFHSHTDKRHKDSLLKTVIHWAYALSSTTEAFNGKCVKWRPIFSRLATLRALLIPLSAVLFLEMLRQAQRKETAMIVGE